MQIPLDSTPLAKTTTPSTSNRARQQPPQVHKGGWRANQPGKGKTANADGTQGAKARFRDKSDQSIGSGCELHVTTLSHEID